jgi:L-fuconolactonase
MMIDSHHHFFTKDQYTKIYETYGSPDILKPLLNDFTPQDMKPLIDEVGVGDTILVQIGETLEHTYDMLSTADRYPWVSGVIGWVNLKDPALGATLDKLSLDQNFCGIRHPLEHESDPSWVLSETVIAGLREIEKRELVFDLLVGPRHWALLPELMSRLPDMSMVLEHFGRPDVKNTSFEDWERMMVKMSQYPNLVCKLSGIMVLIADENWGGNWEPGDFRQYIDRTIDLFGVDRVMFGSDWPVSTLVGSYEENIDAIQVCVSGLSDDEKVKIFSDNARRIYKIS